MSKVKDNMVTEGLSGKLGKQIVFRQWSGATILAKAPVMNPGLLKNEAAIKNMIRFKEATVYAKKAMSDPELKQAYESKCKACQNAYARAIQDFFSIPSVEEIDLSNYTGEPDSFIRIYATDSFRISQVQVRIEDAQGSLVEEGFAEQEEATGWWRFTAKVQNQLLEGGKVIATASNLPGNETTKEVNMAQQ